MRGCGFGTNLSVSIVLVPRLAGAHTEIAMQDTAAAETSIVPASALAFLNHHFGKLAKRAKRLDTSAPRLTVVRTYLEPTGNVFAAAADGRVVRETREMAEVRVDGARPTVTIDGASGWRPVANLVHAPEGNVVRARQGFAVPSKYDTRQICDHCGTRRARKETWLFRHTATGRIVQCGRTCTQDYTGGALRPTALALWADAWGVVKGEREFVREESFGPTVREYLQYVAAQIRVDRYFVSGTKAREQGRQSTGQLAMNALNVWASNAKMAREVGLARPNGDDIEIADQALAWLETTTECSQYMASLRAACSMYEVTAKTQGYVASLVGSAYPRAMAKDAKRAKAVEDASCSQHVGEVGKRGEFAGIVTRVRQWQGHYGMTTLVVIKLDSGDILQWYASGDRSDIVEGRAYTVRATVKKHDTDRYTSAPVTVVSRAVVTPCEP